MNQIIITPVKDQVFQVIKERILTQHYQFGERINVAGLVEELKISNTPVREALSMLVESGLVIVTPNAGFKVFELTETFARDLRQTIETITIGAYFVCINEKRIDQLLEIMEERLEQQEAANSSTDLAKITAATARFDGSFFEVLNNEKLRLIYNNLFDFLYLGILNKYKNVGVQADERLNEHKEIYLAVKSGQTDQVISILHKHWEYVQNSAN